LHDAGIVQGDFGVEGDGAADGVFAHDVHHAPDADAVAVVAAAVVADVRGIGKQVDVEMFDVGDDPDGDAALLGQVIFGRSTMAW
jgi:hypothetical protein